MTTLKTIMARAHALLPASASPDPDAYDQAMDALEHEVRRAITKPTVEPVDPYAGLPVYALMNDGPFIPFSVPVEPVKLHPDMVQMMDDMAQYATQ